MTRESIIYALLSRGMDKIVVSYTSNFVMVSVTVRGREMASATFHQETLNDYVLLKEFLGDYVSLKELVNERPRFQEDND